MEFCEDGIDGADMRLMNDLLIRNKPVVLKNMLSSWSSVPWTLDEVAEQCGSTVLKFRVVHYIQAESQTETKLERWKPKDKDPVWEGEGDSVKTNLKNFIDWIKGEISDPDENPFSIYSTDDHWAYSSYNTMSKIFDEDCPIMKAVDWSPFGFPRRRGDKSTFWIGSSESCTPCHMDTYGCNLFAQVIGRKQWVLFPPEDTNNLYATRIPYEESSIFSLVNMCKPNLMEFPYFKNTHPHVVILEPGDVLFIPPKWWHFVAAIDTSLSINTWIELEQDDEARLEEAVTKGLMSIIIPMCDINKDEICWLNPGEELEKPENIDHVIKTALDICLDNFVALDYADEDSEPECSHGKVLKGEEHADVHTTVRTPVFTENITPVPQLSFSEYHARYCCHDDEKEKEKQRIIPLSDPVHLKSIVNCFVHPDVVTCIAQKLKDLRIGSLYVPPS